jgi:hypothetical protein
MSRSIVSRLTFLAVAIGLSTSMVGVAFGVIAPGMLTDAPNPQPRSARPETVPVLHGFRLHPIGQANWT